MVKVFPDLRVASFYEKDDRWQRAKKKKASPKSKRATIRPIARKQLMNSRGIQMSMGVHIACFAPLTCYATSDLVESTSQLCYNRPRKQLSRVPPMTYIIYLRRAVVFHAIQ